jgi:type VI secretion system protein ImpC
MMAVNPDILSALMVNPVTTEGALPCRVLCIASFSGREETKFQQFTLDPADPAKALAFFDVKIDLRGIFPGTDAIYSIRQLSDFQPDTLLTRLPVMVQGLELRDQLQQSESIDPDTLDQVFEFLQRYDPDFIGRSNVGTEECEDDFGGIPTDFLYTDLERCLCSLLDQVLHYPLFQTVEASWRQVYELARLIKGHTSGAVELLDANAHALQEDLCQQGDLTSSVLFDRIYSHEFGQFGGQPFNYIAVDYPVTRSEQDLNVLESLARLGHGAHAAVGVPAKPQLLSFDRYEQMLGQNMREWCASSRFLAYKNLAELEASRYLYLMLPRQVLRSPYKGRFSYLSYQEKQTPEGSELLWGSAIYSLAANILFAFEQQKSFTLLTGPEWGRERLFAPYIDPVAGMALSPAEINFPPSLIADLADQGIVAMSTLAEEKSSCFTLLHSFHALTYDDENVPPDSQLPYLLTICRIAHMMKVVFREQIGTLDDPEALRQKLERWLKAFVVDLEAPAEEVMMKKPFRAASVRMEQSASGVGMRVELTPHLRFMNQPFSLSLDLILQEAG